MRQLILYIMFVMTMVLTGYGKVSAASNHSTQPTTEDRLQKVEHKENHHDAQLEDASMMAYRVCNSRPQRLSPTGNMHAGHAMSRLLFNKIRFLSLLIFQNGGEGSRLESAPVHFDVASKYYVICLRHLRC